MIKTELDLDKLRLECKKLSFSLDGSGAEMFCVQSQRVPNNYPEILKAVGEISGLRKLDPLYLMVNRLKPGVIVPVHRDFLVSAGKQKNAKYPTFERWHLPVQTNEDCGFWDEENGHKIMKLGFWWGPVPYWKFHQVWNKGEYERIHLIVDLDSEPMGEYT